FLSLRLSVSSPPSHPPSPSPSPPPSLLLFFFHPPPAPRHLPSSPTRRSSDLQDPRRQPRRRVRQPDAQRPRSRRLDVPVRPLLRSEEHTSELQSLTNLVCRLLLEKKKKQKTHTQHRRTQS